MDGQTRGEIGVVEAVVVVAVVIVEAGFVDLVFLGTRGVLDRPFGAQLSASVIVAVIVAMEVSESRAAERDSAGFES